MRARGFIVIGVAAVIGLAGCGGGSSDEVSSRSTASSGTEGTPSTVSSGEAVSGGAAAGISGACADGLAFSQAYGSAFAGAANPGAAALPNAEAVRASFTAAIEVAPAEIKSDMQLLGKVYLPFFEAMAKANYDITKLDPSIFESVSAPDVSAAAEKVTAYFQKNCS